MSIPLIVSLVNRSKDEILDVLQGISRYIEEIHVQEPLIQNEGIDILAFLKARYPKKKIVVDISTAKKLDENYSNWIKRSSIKTFIIASDLTPTNFKEMVTFLREHKKNIIVKGQKFSNHQLQKFDIQKVFFYRPQPKKQDRIWTQNEYLQMKSLIKKGFFLLIGDININNLASLNKLHAVGFTISDEVCYSFNPIETSKRIYLKIKDEYATE